MGVHEVLKVAVAVASSGSRGVGEAAIDRNGRGTLIEGAVPGK